MSGAYAKAIGDRALLNGEGVALLGQTITREANILAYNDAFLLAAIIALFALAVLLIQIAVKRLARHDPDIVPAATS